MKFFQGEGFRRGAWSEHFQKNIPHKVFSDFQLSCIVWRGKLFRQMKCPIPLSIDLKHVLNVCCSTKWNFQGNSTQIHKFSSYYLRSTDLKNHPWQRKISAGKSKFLKKYLIKGPWLQSTEPCKVNFNFLNNKFRLCT